MAISVGFIGLGVMGGPMAAHLAAASQTNGIEVLVYNRTPGRASRPIEKGAKEAESLEQVAECCSTIILCVTRTEDVQDLLTLLVASAKPGTLFIDHSTISPVGAVAIEKWLRAQGHRFVDAPVTGGSMGAEKGQLVIFCGGEERDVSEAQGIVAPYTKRSERMGGPGSGQWAKMANQIAVGAALVGLCESLAFAEKAGLDLELTREMILGGAGGSWAYENYGAKLLKRDWTPGFSIDNQVKDFDYCHEAAESIDVPIPSTDLLNAMLKELQSKGKGSLTTVALFDWYFAQEKSG